MKKIAAFQLNFNGNIDDFENIEDSFYEWLKAKGELQPTEKDNRFEFNFLNTGLKGSLELNNWDCSEGVKKSFALFEPKDIGSIKTNLEYSLNIKTELIQIYIDIIQGTEYFQSSENIIIKKPSIIDKLLGDFYHKLENVPVIKHDLKRKEGLKKYLDIFFSLERTHPLVVISSADKYKDLSRDLLDKLSFDLKGTAYVVRIDDYISRKISNEAGNYWSCFDGAIRIFWPQIQKISNPFQHPLIKFDRIFNMGPRVDDMVMGMRNQLRKKLIMELSPLAIHRPEFFRKIDNLSREETFSKKVEKLKRNIEDSEVYEELLQELNKEISILEQQNINKDNEIAQLEYKLSDLQQEVIREEINKEDRTDFDTFQDAVLNAQQNLSKTLLFSPKIDKYIENVDPAAGPPNEIYRYLVKLELLSNEIKANNGKLGKSHIKWLSENGVKCSGESETIKNDPKRMQERTFNVAEKEYKMEKHLKLGDAYDAAHCIRIYFEWDANMSKMVIGYIGRHLN